MASAIKHYSVSQYESWYDTATWAADGAAVNLTGYTAALYVHKGDTATASMTLTSTGGTLTIGATAGTVAWSVAPATLAAMDAGEYTYNLVLTSAGGVARCIMAGRLTIVEEGGVPE